MSVAAEDPVCSKTLCDLTHHVGGKHSEGVVEQEPLAYNCAKEVRAEICPRHMPKQEVRTRATLNKGVT